MRELREYVKELVNNLGYDFDSFAREMQDELICLVNTEAEEFFRAHADIPDMRFGIRKGIIKPNKYWHDINSPKKNVKSNNSDRFSQDSECSDASCDLTSCDGVCFDTTQTCQDHNELIQCIDSFCINSAGGASGTSCQDGNCSDQVCINYKVSVCNDTLPNQCSDTVCANWYSGCSSGDQRCTNLPYCRDHGCLADYDVGGCRDGCSGATTTNGGSNNNNVCLDSVGCTDDSCKNNATSCIDTGSSPGVGCLDNTGCQNNGLGQCIDIQNCMDTQGCKNAEFCIDSRDCSDNGCVNEKKCFNYGDGCVDQSCSNLQSCGTIPGDPFPPVPDVPE